MSLEIKIPKEVTKYEAKLVGPLTAKQTVYCGIGGLLVIGVRYICNIIAPEATTVAMVLTFAPFALLGFCKPYGQPLDKFIVGYIKTNMLSPRMRKSKIKNQFEAIDKEMKMINGTKTKGKYKKSKAAFK